MKKRTPQSAASLATVTTLPNLRPAPPAELASDEAAHWHLIVQYLPSDWFRAADLPVLTAYCRAIALHEKASAQLKDAPLVLTAGNGREYKNPLLTIQNTAALQLCTLAAKLRLTPSSRYDAKSAHTAASRSPSGGKPWEFDALDVALGRTTERPKK